MDRHNDVCQIALVERHRGTGAVVNGFVSGFGYMQDCAMASTVAHDSHHMIVVGTNKEDMALAANRLGEVGGGVVIFSKGKELALVEMPIAGLMSDERAEIVAAKAEKLTPRCAPWAAASTTPTCSIRCWRWWSSPSSAFPTSASST